MNIVCMMSSLQLGGAERQLIGLAAVLARSGHNVELLTYHKKGVYSKGGFYSPAVAELSLKQHSIERKGPLGVFLGKVAAYLDSVSCDVLISFKAGCSLKACALKLLRPRMRVFVSERNMNLRYLPHDAFRFFVFRHCAEKVICNNHSQEKFIREHYPSLADKLVTIPNFVDTGRFFPAENPVVHVPRRIIVTARICARKNMKGLILAAEMLKGRGDLPPFRIEWYGMSRRSSYLRRMQGLVRSKGLEEMFLILPATEDVAGRYNDSDIFCLPSFYEGTSNSLAEALSCGKVAVCSRVSDNPLYVKEGVDGFLFDPHSPSSIADSLAKALKMSEKEMADAGRSGSAIVREKLSVESFARSYLELLR